ncbi:hypothetical protein I601_2754 [Nocardioides dokdonensis FR1436]|uniref:Uncharacterized protein n=1 Tax=Nocardioides dokdonensis FR1436 TaxID=1300347 RepID=A0A1A9GND2_9ACTN|nr:hypothetical protein [Nocardioides dokdonensis]ANH39170.1 hypothetical protein I601_2754 [Nocardioides dokdonensis FR1436]
MSKERARRREARMREQALLTAARASEAERRERRTARRRALASWLPQRRRRPTGILAERDRRQRGTTVALLVLVNVLVALLTDGWAWPALSLVVTLLAAPVLHTLLFRRS